MKKLLPLLLVFLLVDTLAYGQQPLQTATLTCASEEMMASKPGLLLLQQQLDEAIFAKTQNNTVQKAQALPYMLPVVVHIIHNNGAENILDAQVLTAIEHLNQAFAHEGYYAAQGNGANTQIQFCLAKRDPNGNATSGITRTVSPLTNMTTENDDIALKDLSRWDPTQYVNVWVVASITSQSSGPGVAGYAYLASAHGQPYDGLVCEVEFFGTSPAQDAVFIHEIGHYLNLYHTFQGGCANDDCLNNGDHVCDTPPDQGVHTNCVYNSCSSDTADPSTNNPFSTNVDDMTENFMDYSPFQCYRSFTNGQGERMRNAIEVVRSSLINSNGCYDNCPLPVIADFQTSSSVINAGQSIDFLNWSSGAVAYEWLIDGVVFSTSTNFNHAFNSPGQYEVILKAVGTADGCFDEKKIDVLVECQVVAGFVPSLNELNAGEIFSAINTSTNATSFEWLINGVPISTASDLNITLPNPGLYSVLLTATGDYCSDETSVFVVRVWPNSMCLDTLATAIYELTNTAFTNQYLHFAGIRPNGDMYFNGYFPFEGALISKLDFKGNIKWQKKFLTGNGINLRLTDDGGTISKFIGWGPSNYHSNICKMDGDGNIEWGRALPEIPSFAHLMGDGAFCFLQPLGASTLLHIVRLGSEGQTLVNKTYDMESNLSYLDVVSNHKLDYHYLCGYGFPLGAFILKMDGSGNMLSAMRYNDQSGNGFEFRSMDVTPDGGIIASGRRTITSTSQNDFLLCKLDSNLQVEWCKMINNDGSNSQFPYESGSTVITKPDGSGFFVEYHLVTQQTYILSFSNNGDFEYARTMLWPDGSPMEYFEIEKQLGRSFLWGRNPNMPEQMVLARLNPGDGSFVGCFNTPDFTVNPFDFPLNGISFDFTLTADTTAVSETTDFVETTHNHTVINKFECIVDVPCPEDCTNAFDDDEDGYVDCFDSDCQCFNGNDCDFVGIASTPVKGKIAWQTPTDLVNASAIPMVANLDPQNGNIPEIIVPVGDPGGSSGFGVLVDKLLIFQGDGSNASNPDVLNIPEKTSNRFSTYAIADVNSDGTPELAVSTQFGFVKIYSNFTQGSSQPMSVIATGAPAMWAHGHLAFADFDQDGRPELYNGNNVYQFDLSNPSFLQLNLKLSGSSHSGHNNSGSSGAIAVDILSVADCNGDPDCNGLELVAGAVIYSIDLDPLDGDGLEIKVVKNLNNLSSLGPFQDGYNYVADLDLDGQLEIVTAGHHGPSNKNGFYVWNKNGLIRKFENPDPNITDPQFISLAIANVFDDHSAGFALDFPEIIYPSNTKITSFNLQKALVSPNTPYWWSANSYDSSRAAGPSCFDFNNDGFAEIVYRDEKNMRIMYGGPLPFPAGVDNDRNWMKFECKSATMDEYPVVADIDGDDEAEIVVTGYIAPFNVDQTDNRGRLLAIESDSLPWSPARNLWNQYNYLGVNINDDLTVPQSQQPHHLEWPQLGSGKRPWNICHTQWPKWGNDFNPSFPVPDAVVTLDSTACEGDSILLWLSLCNQGSITIPTGFPLSFYENDPRLPGSQLRGTYNTSTALPVDSCLVLPLKIPAVLNAPVFAVANDDGTHPLPYAMSDFPLADQPECDFDNNFDHYTIFYQSPSLDLGPDRSLCSSSVTELNAGAGFASYRWQDGSTDPSFTAFGPGTYWVDVQGECGNPLSDTITISLNQTAAIELGNDREICEGESVQLTVAGFPTTSWYPSFGLSCNDCPSPVASPGISTTYYVTASLGDCFASDSVRVSVKEKPLLSVTAQDGDCTNLASVSTNVVGQGPFSYNWSGGQTSSSINPTVSGNYVVSVSGANGCVAVDSASVVITNNLVNSISAQPVSCNGSPGLAAISTTGGTEPYTYQWSNGGDMASVSVTTPGNITVTVTDAMGCISFASVDIGLSGQLQLGVTVSPISCHEGTDGSATVIPIFGTPPFAWQWQDGQTTSTISGLGGGSYSVTVSDAIGCTDDLHFSMTSPPDLLLNASASNISCFGENDGTATVIVSGGTPGYEYFWSNFQTTATATPLPEGWHSVTVTDENGCQDSVSVFVQQPPLLTATAEAEDPFLCPEQTTNVQAIANGGTPPFTYSWVNLGEMDSLLTDVGAGAYTVIVTDANGCTTISMALVQTNSSVVLTLDSIVAASSPTTADGAIFVDFINGLPPFSFLWSNGTATQNLQDVLPGDYSLTITDVDGCEQVFTFTVDFLNAISEKQGAPWRASIYPNPTDAGGMANLFIQADLPQSIDIQLFDITGKLLAQDQIKVASGGFSHKLTPPNVSGLYVVVLKNENEAITIKWAVMVH